MVCRTAWFWSSRVSATVVDQDAAEAVGVDAEVGAGERGAAGDFAARQQVALEHRRRDFSVRPVAEIARQEGMGRQHDRSRQGPSQSASTSDRAGGSSHGASGTLDAAMKV